MRIKNRALSLLTVSLLLSVSCQQEEKYVKPDGGYNSGGNSSEEVQRDPDWAFLASSVHPRILITDAQLFSLKSRVESGNDPYLTRMHNAVMSAANSVNVLGGADLDFLPEEVGYVRLNGQGAEILSRLCYLSYAWRMTGDSKYLTAAENILVKVSRFDTWYAPLHFLVPTRITLGFALAYDWLYSGLSAGTKALVEKAIQDKYFYPVRHKLWNNNFYESQSNWNAWCNCSIIMAAMALYETDPAGCKELIEASVASIPQALIAIFSPNGISSEGPGYLGVTTQYQAVINTLLKDLLKTDYGFESIEGWRDASVFTLFIKGIKGSFNFSDSGEGVGFYPAQWYYAYAFKDTSVLFDEIAKGPDTPYPELVYVLSWAARMSGLNIGQDTPSRCCFYGRGSFADLYIARTLWDGSDRDKYLGVKGGKAKVSHGHMDAGSFVYDAFGVRWSIDLGSDDYQVMSDRLNELKAQGISTGDYQDGAKWQELRLNNRFHSTLTLNDEDHRVDGFASITGSLGTLKELGCTVDMTPVFGSAVQKAVRDFSLKDDVLTINDYIKAPASVPVSVSWRMVTRAGVTIGSDHIRLEQGGKTLYLKSSAAGAAVSYFSLPAEWPGTLFDGYNSPNPGVSVVGFTSTVPADANRTFSTTLSPSL